LELEGALSGLIRNSLTKLVFVSEHFCSILCLVDLMKQEDKGITDQGDFRVQTKNN
jgi:hypothetical protein